MSAVRTFRHAVTPNVRPGCGLAPLRTWYGMYLLLRSRLLAHRVCCHTLAVLSVDSPCTHSRGDHSRTVVIKHVHVHHNKGYPDAFVPIGNQLVNIPREENKDPLNLQSHKYPLGWVLALLCHHDCVHRMCC